MTLPSSEEISGERLALLYQLSQAFNSTLDLDEVLERVMDEIIAAIQAERGFVMLRSETGRLSFQVARGMDHNTIDQPEFQVSRGIIEEVAQEGKPLLTSDAQRDPRFSSRQSVQGLRLRSILCAPLKYKDRITGVVYLDNRLQAGIFTKGDLHLLISLAGSAAIAIENARLYQIAVEKSRLERELNMARKVQASLLPAELPQIPGWEFAATWVPARQVAGDFYDFILGADGDLSFVIADVTDKGLPAALFMVFSRSVLRASARHGTPEACVINANQAICAESSQGLYVTLIYAYLDPTGQTLSYVNAGHNPAMLYRKNTDQFSQLYATGMPLGIDAAAAYRQETLNLASGDFLLLYTDGVTDALNGSGENFDLPRLEAVITKSRHASAAEILHEIKSAMTDFTGATSQFDDITLLIAKKV